MRGFGSFSLFPPILKTLLIINVAIYFIHHFFFGIFTIGGTPMDRILIDWFALQPVLTDTDSAYGFMYSPKPFFIWQLVSYQFLHGGLWHIFFNMFALWMFGSELENLWGSRRFLFYYLLCGIGAGLVQLFISPMFAPPAPTIGASGAVYGILLAFGLTFPSRPIYMFPFFIPIPAKFFVIIFAVIEMISGISGGGGVAHFAHLGGAATGFLLIKFGDKIGIYKFFDRFFKAGSKRESNLYSRYSADRESAPVYRVNWVKTTKPDEDDRTYMSRRPQAPPVSINGEEITQEKIDAILDKIAESGYQNITERERRILLELSKKL